MSDPTKVVVAGDWHGETYWALDVIEEAVTALHDEEVKVILHTGDLGVWPTLWRFRKEVSEVLASYGMQLWFVDGNHEHHDYLESLKNTDLAEDGKVYVTSSIHWLPRGYRWQWHGRTWLAMGGAVSPDQVIRTPGHDWFPQESISEADYWRAVEGGRAHVVVAHDCPAGVDLDLGDPPSWWRKSDLQGGEVNRERLYAICRDVDTAYVLHGHYHLAHESYF